MSSLALVSNCVWAARLGRACGQKAIKPFLTRLPRSSPKLTLLAKVLALLILAAVLPQAALAAHGTWSSTGPMVNPCRDSHTATLLSDGRVLVAGGLCGGSNTLASAEIYDPATGTWKSTGSMHQARLGHTATLLPNGWVLVIGGAQYNSGGSHGLESVEYYVPEMDGWLDGTSIYNQGRAFHTATLLPNGKVLVAGGSDGYNTLESALLYDPASDNWSPTGFMITPRQEHTATLLPDGKVLVAGGWNANTGEEHASAELYDPAGNGGAGAWSPTQNSMSVARYGHAATLMRNGKVLLVGGESVAAVDLYDVSTGHFYATASLSPPPYSTITSTLLASGQALETDNSSSHLYDPVTETWSPTGAPLSSLQDCKATLLANGQVLAAGPYSVELYDPVPPPKVPLPPLQAFYPFNGDARDYSGHGRDCEYYVGYQPQLVPGYQGQAYSFNGGLFIFPLNINPSNYPRLTMGAWAKPTASGTIAPLLTHDTGGYGRQLGLDTRGGGIGWSAFCGDGGVLGAVPAIQGQWTFVAVVYDQAAQTVKLQVDDMVLIRTGVTLGPGDNVLYIGGSPPYFFNEFFNGVIDNVFVFGDALTDQQLAYIRSRGVQAFHKTNPGLLLLLID